MKQFFITFVCHCEKIWWDKSYESLSTSVRSFLDMQQEVSQKLGYSITSTFCTLIDHPTSEQTIVDISFVPDLFQEVKLSGNEIGLHIHCPIKEMKSGIQDRLIKPDAEFLASLGFKPVTYAAGDWITSPNTISALEETNFKVDCSVYSLEFLREKFGVKRDYTKRKNLKPYHPDYSDVCSEGKSKIVELPVSGNLSEFNQDIYSNLLPITERISKRFQKLSRVDIFQIFWHPFEIATLDDKTSDELLKQGIKPESFEGKIGVDWITLNKVKDFLIQFGQNSDVKIVSAVEAAEEFINSKKGQI